MSEEFELDTGIPEIADVRVEPVVREKVELDWRSRCAKWDRELFATNHIDVAQALMDGGTKSAEVIALSAGLALSYVRDKVLPQMAMAEPAEGGWKLNDEWRQAKLDASAEMEA